MTTRLLAIALAAALPLAAACSETKRPDGGSGMLPLGAVAPDFEAKDAEGKTVRLSDGKDHARVVYFYPKDDTPGCTKEACAFRDAWNEYTKRGVWVFGVSRDSEESHRKFRETHKLPFPLAARVTFLVDKDGKIAREWPEVDPAVHAAEVLAKIE